MKVNKNETIKVVIEINKTAYNVLCCGVDAGMVASIYYKCSTNEMVEKWIENSEPTEDKLKPYKEGAEE